MVNIVNEGNLLLPDFLKNEDINIESIIFKNN